MTEDNLARTEAPAGEQQNLLKLKPVPTDVSDFDKLLATGERLLRHKQEQLSRAEGDYQRQRVELIERYRAMVERTKREAEEQVRLLDQAHVNNVALIERTITALKGLRG